VFEGQGTQFSWLIAVRVVKNQQHLYVELADKKDRFLLEYLTNLNAPVIDVVYL
jgi:hypothetical protein